MSSIVNDLVLNEGSLAVKVEGIRASQTVTFSNNSLDGGETITVNGAVFTEGVDFADQASDAATAQDFADAVDASTNVLVKGLIRVKTVVGGVVTLEAVDAGTAGNLFTLAESDGATDDIALGGALFTGGLFCQGVYEAEEEGADFIAPLEDGLEFTPNRELLDRNIRTSTTESVPSRVGIKSSTGTIPLELKAGSTEGSLPEYDALLLATFGARRRSVNSITTDTGHSSTVVNLTTADIGKVKVGDIVKIKKIGLLDQDHISPVTAVDTVLETITLLIPATDVAGSAVSVPDNAIIAPFTTYYVDQSQAPTVSATNYVGGKIREKITGLRVVSMDINNFSTGQIGDLSFGVEGINFLKEVGEPLFTPVFDTSVPPIMLDAKVYQGANEILVNTFAVNVSNTAGFKTATGDVNGRISSRFTDISVSGSIDPYTSDSNVDNFDLFNANSAFSLFSRAFNPTSTAGEKTQVVAMYVPNCRMTEITTGDQEGLATDAIAYSGHKTLGNDTFFMTII